MTIKTLKNSFDYIDAILDNVAYKAINWPFPAEDLILNRGKRCLSINFTYDRTLDRGCKMTQTYKNGVGLLAIENKFGRFIIPSGSSYKSNPYDLIAPVQQMSLQIKELYSESFPFEQEIWCRIIQPIEKFDFFHDIYLSRYQADGQSYSTLMDIQLQDVRIEVYSNIFKGRQYIIFDTTAPIKLSNFSDHVFSIICALGLFSQEIWMDESITLAYEDENMDNPIALKFQGLRETVRGSYPIFTTKFHGYVDQLSQNSITKYAADYLEGKLGNFQYTMINWVNQDQLSALCRTLDNHEALRRVALMIVEASSFPLEYQVSMLSVALETITSYYQNKSKKNNGTNKELTPVPEEIFNVEILPSLLDCISDMQLKHNDLKEGLDILKNKLKGLNSPTNHAKLSMPFDMVGYKLSQFDTKEIKNNRNRFLHGSLFNKPTEDEEFNALLKSSLRLHKLCSILLLKEANFDNYILNNPVLWGIEDECKAQELPVIKI